MLTFQFIVPQESNRLEYLIPKKTSLRHRLPMADQGFIEFVAYLLEVNPKKRPSASEALKHPWLSFPYEPISSWHSCYWMVMFPSTTILSALTFSLGAKQHEVLIDQDETCSTTTCPQHDQSPNLMKRAAAAGTVLAPLYYQCCPVLWCNITFGFVSSLAPM